MGAACLYLTIAMVATTVLIHIVYDARSKRGFVRVYTTETTVIFLLINRQLALHSISKKKKIRRLLLPRYRRLRCCGTSQAVPLHVLHALWQRLTYFSKRRFVLLWRDVGRKEEQGICSETSVPGQVQRVCPLHTC